MMLSNHSSKQKIGFVLFFALLFTLILPLHTVLANPLPTSTLSITNIQIGANYGGGVGDRGDVHFYTVGARLVWLGRDFYGDDKIVIRTTLDGTTWTAAETALNGNVSGSNFAIGGYGNTIVTVLCQYKDGVGYMLYRMGKVDEATGAICWLDAQQEIASIGEEYARQVKIALNSLNETMIAWTQDMAGDIEMKRYMLNDAVDGTWNNISGAIMDPFQAEGQSNLQIFVTGGSDGSEFTILYINNTNPLELCSFVYNTSGTYRFPHILGDHKIRGAGSNYPIQWMRLLNGSFAIIYEENTLYKLFMSIYDPVSRTWGTPKSIFPGITPTNSYFTVSQLNNGSLMLLSKLNTDRDIGVYFEKADHSYTTVRHIDYNEYQHVHAPIIAPNNTWGFLTTYDDAQDDTYYCNLNFVQDIPISPIPDQPILLTPLNNTLVGIFYPFNSTWTFNDLEDGGVQTAYRLMVANNSGFTSPFLDTGKLVNSNTWHNYTGSDVMGVYYWNVTVWDSGDNSNTSKIGRYHVGPLIELRARNSTSPLVGALINMTQLGVNVFSGVTNATGGASSLVYYNLNTTLTIEQTGYGSVNMSFISAHDDYMVFTLSSIGGGGFINLLTIILISFGVIVWRLKRG